MRRVNAVVSRLTWSPDSGPALDLDKVKRQRRLGSTTSIDDLIDTWISGATSHFQEQTGRQIITAPFEYRVDCCPPVDRYIEIPKAPLQAVTAFKYLDGDEAEQTFDAENYTVITPKGDHCAPGRVVLNSDASWPSTLQREGAVWIEFTAGYGDTPADVPALIQSTLMFLVGHFHRYGEEVQEGTLQTLPLGAATLIQAFKYSALPTQRPWEVSWLD